MNNITTLENVFQRVDVMFQTCHDSFIPVKDISFDDLDTIKIDCAFFSSFSSPPPRSGRRAVRSPDASSTPRSAKRSTPWSAACATPPSPTG